ncbi:MAG: secretion protein HlyD family protein [Gemmatimonadetes bacterium]|nr:secretion protein HlyD family protein [Gemmatimonadota bacterium]
MTMQPTRAPSTRRMTVRARNSVIGVVLLAVLVTLALVLRPRRDAEVKQTVADSKVANSRAGGGGASGMEGMAGMPSEQATTGGSVRLTSGQLKQFGVTFGAVAIRTLSSESRVAGVVTVDEGRLAQVVPKFSGFVERLYVNATGQPVRRGQAMADVYSPDLVSAQQELLLAGQLQRDIGRSAVPGVPGSTTDLVSAATRRLQLWDISEAQIAEVLRTGKVRRTLTLYAPASGIVLEKKVMQGQAITAGEQLYTIAGLGDVWVEVSLRESDAAAVKSGTSADIELTGLPGRTFKGRVTYVYPTLDAASRSVRARVVVTNTDGALKPGMYATVRLSTPSRAALTVPTSALLRAGDRTVAFMDVGGGALMPMDVTVGRSTGEYTEVLSGLDEGQRVVTSAQFLLDSESNLGEVMKSMVGQTTSAPTATPRR